MKTYTLCPRCSAVNGVGLEHPGQPRCGVCQAPLTDYQDGISALNGVQVATLASYSPLPLAVDAWAPWCAPCRAFVPVFRQASRDLAGRVAFAKLDTEADPSAGERFGIQAIPTLLLFKAGRELSRISGALPLEAYRRWLEEGLRA